MYIQNNYKSWVEDGIPTFALPTHGLVVGAIIAPSGILDGRN